MQANKHETEEDLWRYNGMDCTYTHEIAGVERAMIEKMGLQSAHDFQQAMFYPVLQAMQRGIKVDKTARALMNKELSAEMLKREQFFRDVLGHNLNPRSPLQMKTLFYEDLKQPPIMKRGAPGKPPTMTCDDEALIKIGKREPLLQPVIRNIQEYRTLGVFKGTFIESELDIDGRMRCSYNICGTESFRLNSSINAFGSGGNMQNVPMGGEDDDSDLVLPNIRKIYVPDDGYEMFDTDLSKADLRVVAWESNCLEMKAMLAEGRDPYIEAAREFYKDPSIKKTRPDGSANPKYKHFKAFAHGTHYLQSPHGLAQRQAMTVYAAEKLQAWYFGKYPEIKAWQKDFKEQVYKRRFVENMFGYRRYYFDKISDDTCREAIAWVPQSTVAIYINKMWYNIWKNFPEIWVLLQVHDSLVGQYPIHMREECLAKLTEASRIIVPYGDPLIIPVGVKTSAKSWGDCE